jgi:hypothetical protein
VNKKLEKYLQKLIEFIVEKYDPEKPGKDGEGSVRTAAKQFLETLVSMGLDPKLTGDALKKDIEDRILSLGPEAFFGTFFDESSAKSYLGGLIDGFNTNSNFGFLNEGAQLDTLANMQADAVAASVPYLLGSEDLKLSGGNSKVNMRSTQDIELATKGGGPGGKVFFGASLKLVTKTSNISTGASEDV